MMPERGTLPPGDRRHRGAGSDARGPAWRPPGPRSRPSLRWVSLASVGLVVTGLLVTLPSPGAGGSVPSPAAGSAGVSPEVRIPGAVPALPSGARVVGPADGATTITADVTLNPPHPAALDAYADAVSDPGSAHYRHYLTTRQFAAAFGPGPATLVAVRAWLASAGLEVGRFAPNGLMVPVTGTVATMERAFAVPLVDAQPQRWPGGPGGHRRTAGSRRPGHGRRRGDRAQYGGRGSTPRSGWARPAPTASTPTAGVPVRPLHGSAGAHVAEHGPRRSAGLRGG